MADKPKTCAHCEQEDCVCREVTSTFGSEWKQDDETAKIYEGLNLPYNPGLTIGGVRRGEIIEGAREALMKPGHREPELRMDVLRAVTKSDLLELDKFVKGGTNWDVRTREMFRQLLILESQARLFAFHGLRFKRTRIDNDKIPAGLLRLVLSRDDYESKVSDLRDAREADRVEFGNRYATVRLYVSIGRVWIDNLPIVKSVTKLVQRWTGA